MSKLIKISAFADAVKQGVEAFETAGKLLVEMLDADPSAKEKITEAQPWLTPEMLDLFERVGRRQLYSKLLLNESPGFLALRRCNYAEQERYFTDTVPMLIESSKGYETLNVALMDMTRDQVRQVFAGKHIRALPEQRAWMESERRKMPPSVSIDEPYEIRRKKLIVTRPCEFTASQLLDLAKRAME